MWIAGVDDPHYYGCDDLGTALSDVPNDGFKVLLAHTPEMYEEARSAGINLYLCGHTHGEGFAQILPNLVARTGGARYGDPVLQAVIEVE